MSGEAEMDELLKQARDALEPFARQDLSGMISFDELDIESDDFDRTRTLIPKLDVALAQQLRDAPEGWREEAIKRFREWRENTGERQRRAWRNLCSHMASPSDPKEDKSR